MAIRRQFPYSNLHDANIDWILEIIEDFENDYQGINQALDDAINNIIAKGNATTDDIEELRISAMQALEEYRNSSITAIENAEANSIANVGTAATNGVNTVQNLINTIPANYADALGQLIVINSILNGTESEALTWAQGIYQFNTTSQQYEIVNSAYYVSSVMQGGCNGRRIKIKSNNSAQKIYSILWWDAYKNLMNTVNMGWVESVEYVFPQEAHFFSIVLTGATNPPNASISVNNTDVNIEWYNALNYIKNYLFKPITLTQDFFTTLTPNGYLLTTGVTSPSPDWHTSDYIEYDMEFPISYSIIGHYRVASLMFFDENKEILNYVNASGTQQNVKITGTATIPYGTKYFRYSVRIDTQYGTNSDYIKYYSPNIQTIIRKILTDKKWNVMGDSITANNTYASKRYFELISERQDGMIIRNYGIGGSRIGGTDSNSFCNRYSNMDADADIITVYGGVNDYGQNDPTPLGAYGDTTSATFYGALKILLEGLITKYPYALIVFCTPIQPNYSSWTVGLEANSLGFTIYDYADAIIKMCGRYGVPVVDLCRVCGFTSRIEAEKTKYFYDGLHLNNNGHNKISYLIEDAMIINSKGKII